MNRLDMAIAAFYHSEDYVTGCYGRPDMMLLGDENIINSLAIVRETLMYLPEEDVEQLYARYLSSLNL
jgi:hypothetical protein